MTASNTADLTALRAENASLKSRIRELEAQINFLGQYRTLAAGIRGERLVAASTSGTFTPHTSPFDILGADGSRIEVKLAKKTAPVPAHPNHLRWQWGKVFGETGRKKYDYLLLIGEADQRYQQLYRDSSSPYVIFCLQMPDVSSLTIGGTGAARGITISTNPTKPKGKALRLFNEFQVTWAEVATRFGVTDEEAIRQTVG